MDGAGCEHSHTNAYSSLTSLVCCCADQYKGEPTPSKWPTINSHFGVKDIAGFDKDDTHYYYSWWRNDTSHLHILPSDWNAPVPVGQPISMAVFSAAARNRSQKSWARRRNSHRYG